MPEISTSECPETNYRYEMRGVISIQGSRDHGTYFRFSTEIRSRSEKYFCGTFMGYLGLRAHIFFFWRAVLKCVVKFLICSKESQILTIIEYRWGGSDIRSPIKIWISKIESSDNSNRPRCHLYCHIFTPSSIFWIPNIW